jgi:hypothetical protein
MEEGQLDPRTERDRREEKQSSDRSPFSAN